MMKNEQIFHIKLLDGQGADWVNLDRTSCGSNHRQSPIDIRKILTRAILQNNANTFRHFLYYIKVCVVPSQICTNNIAGLKNYQSVYKNCPFDFHDPWKIENEDREIEWTALNEGHTIKLLPYSENGVLTTISGGHLHGSYRFSHFHFHWGGETTQGSEHKLRGFVRIFLII